jgi:hypothetical protein
MKTNLTTHQKVLWITLAVIVFLVVLRLCLPFIVLQYANYTLNKIPGYKAHIEDVDIAVWRGAYQINGLKIIKKGGDETLPFVDIPQIDLSIQWAALLHGRVVGEIEVTKPTLRFINAKKKENSQFSFTQEWIDQGKKLFPFNFNKVTMTNGHVIFQDFHSEPKIELDLSELNLHATNINNVVYKKDELPAQIKADGVVFNSGRFKLDSTADINQSPESFNVKFEMTDVDLTKINSFTRFYANFDFSSGSLSVFSEVTADKGKFNGYVKPLLSNIKIIDAKEKFDNPFEYAWEGVISLVMNVFKSHSTENFATKTPISGTLHDPSVGLWASIGNVFRNAFIKPFKPELENSIPEAKPDPKKKS